MIPKITIPVQTFLIALLIQSSLSFPSFIEQIATQDPEDLSPFSFTNEFYEAQSAEFKQNAWWNFIKENKGTISQSKVRFTIRMLLDNLNPTVEFDRDYRPWRYGKGIHQIGAVAKISFEVAQTHNFTGLFAEGSQHGLIRMGNAASESGSLNPGLGLKLFRDGASSSNAVCLTENLSLTSLNFFEKAQSNHFTLPDGIVMRLGEAKFDTVYKPSDFVGVSDFAKRNSTGASLEDEDIVSPFRIFLEPNPELKSDFADIESYDTLYEKFESIPSGTLLYQMYGVIDPSSNYPEDAILIGNITTTSEAIHSQNADQYLFFRHQRISEDVDLDDTWCDAVCPLMQRRK